MTPLVKDLVALHQEIAAVSPEDTVRRATTLIATRNFSQVAVESADGPGEKAVSWESIGKARLSGSDPQMVSEVAAAVPSVAMDSPLLEQISTIYEHGFVLVHSANRKTLESIITASDLTLRFGGIARPFLLTEEAERLLRRCVDGAFDLEAIAEAARVRKENVQSAADLTLGNYGFLLDKEENWKQLRWDVDRGTFLTLLDEVRGMRNDIMHFKRGPLSEEEIGKLNGFVELMRKLASC